MSRIPHTAHHPHRAVFLDRDGVLNAVHTDARGVICPPPDVTALRLLPGVAEACAVLHDAGWRLIVVTNQPDVARGTTARETVEAINAVLRQRLPLDDIRVCYHDDPDGCHCRKPLPGMLTDAAHEWRLDLARSVLVGDRWKDIAAGRQAGCGTVLCGATPAEQVRAQADYYVNALGDALPWILGYGG